MENILQHQSNFIRLFTLLSRSTNETYFMFSLQKFLVSIKTVVILDKRPHVQKCYFALLSLLYKLIPYTRDIYGGLGERKLTYSMLFIWKYHFPILTAECLRQLILPIEHNPPYGSWRDIKHFCQFIKTFSEKKEEDPLIETCIALMNHQLDVDNTIWNSKLDDFIRKKDSSHYLTRPNPIDSNLSLVSKWIPRENSSFQWLFKRAAVQFIRSTKPHYFKSCKTNEQFQAALRKGSKEYRQIFSRLSKEWETLEIKQCSNQWESIKATQIPMIAGKRQQLALINLDLRGNTRKNTLHSLERDICAKKVKLHWLSNDAQKKYSKERMNPVFSDMGVFIKTALRANHFERTRVEAEWKHILTQVSSIEQMIPILDASLFLQSPEQFYEALGMACIIAKKSSQRIVLFDNTINIINIEKYNSIQSILEIIKPIYHEHHIGQSFSNLSNTLIQSIENTSLESSLVSNMKLVFFTHFQDSDFDEIYSKVTKPFQDKLGDTPFLLFWRGNQKGILDNPENQETKYVQYSRTLFISGSTNYIWTRIGQLPQESWKNLNSFDFILTLLNQPRYKIFEEQFQKRFHAV